MSKASVTTKQSLSARGILNLGGDEILIEIEDGEVVSLVELLKDFDGREVTISVNNSTDLM
jgi:hypothetical protein